MLASDLFSPKAYRTGAKTANESAPAGWCAVLNSDCPGLNNQTCRSSEEVA